MRQEVVVAAFIARKGKVYLARRSLERATAPGLYHLPGGHVEFAEDPASTLKREIFEELGAEIDVGSPYHTFSYLVGPDLQSVVIVHFARLLNPDQEFTIDPKETISGTWVSKNDLADFVAEDDPNFLAIVRGFALHDRVYAADAMSHRVLYRAFGNAEAHIADMYEVIENLYDLPTLSFTEIITDRALFDYCLDRRHFLLILPYTSRGNILLNPLFSGDQLVWRIVSGGVQSSFDETFIGACQRHISRYFKDVILGEVEPVALLKNTFKFGDEVVEHKGVAFIARVRNENHEAVLAQMPHSRGAFVSIHTPGLTLGYMGHQTVLGHAIPKIVEATKYPNQENEVATNAKYRVRYKLHNAIVKPLVRLASHVAYPSSIHDLEKKIRELVLADKPRSVLDVACGENLSIVNFSSQDKVPLVVGNDISWSQIELMSKRLRPDRYRNSTSFVLFTNHDARRLPFRDNAFDCVICKNVLHHMPDQQSFVGLIREILRIGKRVIIVEILDPKHDDRKWKIRDRYYRHFLKDAGGNFLSREEFDTLTNLGNRIQHFEVETIRGIYQFACFN